MRKALVMSLQIKYAALVLLCLLLLSSSSYCQKKETAIRKIYAQAGLCKPTFGENSIDWGIQAVLKKGFTVSFSNLGTNSTDVEHVLSFGGPSNFGGGFNSDVEFYEVYDYRTTVYNLTGGKCFDMGRSFWATAELGATVVNTKEVYNKYLIGTMTQSGTWIPAPSGPRRNIGTSSKRSTGGGLMLKADFNWAFSSFAGIGVGTFLGFNSSGDPGGLAGAEFKLIVGKMGRKPKGKKSS